MAVTEIGDFLVLSVELPVSRTPHYIYFKKHVQKKDSQLDNNRSLFLFNLPIETTTKVLKKYLQTVAIGATLESFTPSVLTDSVESTWLDLTRLTSDLDLPQKSTHDDGSINAFANATASLLPKHCGVVSFVDKLACLLAFSSLKKIAAAATSTKWPQNDTHGSKYLLQKYRDFILDQENLSTQVSQSMVEFDAAEQKSAEELQKQSQLVDDDGFTLVVGSHRKTKAAIMGKQKLASTVELDKARAKEKSKEKEDFYRFQLRQKKKDEMNDLLRKFKEDQERVRIMKEKKRFRPY